MKFKLNNNSGVLLIVAIWLLIILTVFAVGIGHRNSIGLKLSGYSLDKLKAYYIAKAGLQSVINEIQDDTNDYDTLYECGIRLDEEETLENVFKDVTVGDGFYSIGYEEKSFAYGLIDEGRKINLNAIKAGNYKVLQNLLGLLDVDSSTSEIIASSVCDWHDSDSNVTNTPYGAEDDYYMDLDKPYYCKNSQFEILEELFLVRGMTKEIFLKIKDYITVFPGGFSNLKVNVNTASGQVLKALGDEALDHLVGVSPSDVDSLVNKIIDYRAGDDKIKKTEDDEPIELASFGNLLSEREDTLFRYLRRYFSTKSDYFRANIQGIYQDRKVISEIEVILTRNELVPIYWHEE